MLDPKKNERLQAVSKLLKNKKNKRKHDLLRLEFLRESGRAEIEIDELEFIAQKESNSKIHFIPFQRQLQERRVLSELPILLESLILLVESGLGILPAIHKLLATTEEETKSKNVR